MPILNLNEAHPSHPWENNLDQVKAFFNHYIQSNIQKLPISLQDFELIKNEWASDNYVELFDSWQSQHVHILVTFLILSDGSPYPVGHAQDPPFNKVDEVIILQEITHLSNRILIRLLGMAEKSILEMGAVVGILRHHP